MDDLTKAFCDQIDVSLRQPFDHQAKWSLLAVVKACLREDEIYRSRDVLDTTVVVHHAIKALEVRIGQEAIIREKEDREAKQFVADLDLPARVKNCLMSDGILTVGDVRRHSDGELLRIPSFGRTSLSALRAVIPESITPE